MALDRSGTLFLFELKRTKGVEANLLQVLRYAQKFGRYEYERLDNYFASYQHRRSQSEAAIPLKEAHKEYFSLDDHLPDHDFNRQQRFIVVTNGIDRATYEAVQYWKKHACQ